MHCPLICIARKLCTGRRTRVDAGANLGLVLLTVPLAYSMVLLAWRCCCQGSGVVALGRGGVAAEATKEAWAL
eukprot:283310-Chlamydomonas_euryale.AAC.13